MSVVVRRITCLSLDKEDERIYPVKLLIGDIAKLFLLNGSSVICRVDKITCNTISVSTRDATSVATKSGSRFVLNLSDIKSFDIISRSNMCLNYFR